MSQAKNFSVPSFYIFTNCEEVGVKWFDEPTSQFWFQRL